MTDSKNSPYQSFQIRIVLNQQIDELRRWFGAELFVLERRPTLEWKHAEITWIMNITDILSTYVSFRWLAANSSGSAPLTSPSSLRYSKCASRANRCKTVCSEVCSRATQIISRRRNWGKFSNGRSIGSNNLSSSKLGRYSCNLSKWSPVAEVGVLPFKAGKCKHLRFGHDCAILSTNSPPIEFPVINNRSNFLSFVKPSNFPVKLE